MAAAPCICRRHPFYIIHNSDKQSSINTSAIELSFQQAAIEFYPCAIYSLLSKKAIKKHNILYCAYFQAWLIPLRPDPSGTHSGRTSYSLLPAARSFRISCPPVSLSHISLVSFTTSHMPPAASPMLFSQSWIHNSWKFQACARFPAGSPHTHLSIRTAE